jgi:hypothetical protein
MSIEKVQTAIETSRQEEEPESLEEIKAEPKTALDYLDLIDQKKAKLSGIIDCLRGFTSEVDGSINFINLSWAMHDYTEAIEQLSDDLWEYLKGIGIVEIEKAKQESEA